MAVLQNRKTNDYYLYLGKNRYRNIYTGVEGEIEPSKAQRIFVKLDAATVILEENPNIELLIRTLNLKIEKQTT